MRVVIGHRPFRRTSLRRPVPGELLTLAPAGVDDGWTFHHHVSMRWTLHGWRIEWRTKDEWQRRAYQEAMGR